MWERRLGNDWWEKDGLVMTDERKAAWWQQREERPLNDDKREKDGGVTTEGRKTAEWRRIG